MSDHKFTRRDFLKATLAGSSALVAPTIINYLGKSSPSSDKEFLEIRDGSFYMGGEEYTIKGANYLTRDHPWRMFDEYDPEQIDKELEMASGLGINAVRVGINFCEATGLGPDAEPLSEISLQNFDNFEDFLGIADSKGIKVMPTVIIHPWNAELKKEGNFHITKEYLEGWVPDFKDDERILAWDAFNESEIAKENFSKWDLPSNYSYPVWTRRIADTLKNLDPNHPVTIGLSDTHPAEEIPKNTPENEAKEKVIQALPKYIEHEDFYCFHYYTYLEWFKMTVDKIKEQTNKPIVLQEFGLPTTGSKWRGEDDQEWYYKKILKWSMEEDLSGLMFWELNDHPEEAFRDNPYNPENDYVDDMGVFRDDYSKKPAADKVKEYYKWIL
ncbi:cellulase family glycosylhydrolase [Candidatus Bipolaricaulota bacterium]|nr:cellulase family glycosylhydrolase [Candidatus Bipolaricaulota bacterium]